MSREALAAALNAPTRKGPIAFGGGGPVPPHTRDDNIAPGATRSFIESWPGPDGVLAQPVVLVIPSDIGHLFELHSISVDGVFYAPVTPIPGVVFSEKRLSSTERFDLSTLTPPGRTFDLVLKNISDSPAQFRGVLWWACSSFSSGA